MVTMKINMWLPLLSIGPLLILNIYLIIGAIFINKNIFDIFEISSLIVSSMFLIILLFGCYPYSKMILDDEGVTVENKVKILFFTVFKKSTSTPWSNISGVDYFDFFTGLVPMCFSFIYEEKDKVCSRRINYMFKDYKEGLKYAVTKLPKEKFTTEAQEKLRKMGISI